MKLFNSYLFILLFAFGIIFVSGCEKEDFSTGTSSVLRDGSAWNAEVRVGVIDGEIELYFVGEEDDRTNSLLLGLSGIPQRAFRYDFAQSDAGTIVDPILIISVGGDANCDVYYLDSEATTNFFEVEYFSLEECKIRGSYDLTFRIEEDQQGVGCQSPYYGPVIRFTEGAFEAKIEGCE